MGDNQLCENCGKTKREHFYNSIMETWFCYEDGDRLEEFLPKNQSNNQQGSVNGAQTSAEVRLGSVPKLAELNNKPCNIDFNGDVFPNQGKTGNSQQTKQTRDIAPETSVCDNRSNLDKTADRKTELSESGSRIEDNSVPNQDEKMTKEDFKKYVMKNTDNFTTLENYQHNRLENFKTFCKKCGSDNIIIETSFDYSMGSEYTGIYGEEVKLVFKCKDCGNAEEIVDD